MSLKFRKQRSAFVYPMRAAPTSERYISGIEESLKFLIFLDRLRRKFLCY